MGKSVQKLTDNVTLIASKTSWIEGLAIEQLKTTANLSAVKYAAGMPDLHPGRGYPIGAAFFTKDHIYPALIGNEIGCGMALWQTDLTLNKVNLDKIVKRLEDIEMPLDESWQTEIEQRQRAKNITPTNYDNSLGTIGGGNHFAEFQAFDKIYDQASMQARSLNKRQLQLLVHSGSRGLGQSVLAKHIEAFNHQGLAVNQPEFSAYLAEHNQAVRWAELNRDLIAKRFLQAAKTQGNCILDVNHNLVSQKQINGINGWLHRKGATPADQGVVIIPGSRGDYSYLVKPVLTDKPDNVELAMACLYSLAHGAGRKWKRGDCQARLSHKYKREDLLKTDLGSRVICGNKALLYDEAPQAYKKADSIINDLVDAGLIQVIARLKPVLTFKTNGSCNS